MSNVTIQQGTSIKVGQDTFKGNVSGPGLGNATSFQQKLDAGAASPTQLASNQSSAGLFTVTSSMNRMQQQQGGGSGGTPAFGAGAIGLDGSSGLGGSTGTAATGGQMGGAIGSAAGGDSQGALLNATKAMQETQMSFNLQYLQLQSQMQAENRSYTAVSNIMKTKHDTVKNSISNVR